MLATNATDLRDNLKGYFDQVVDDYETLLVTRKNDGNVVILSQAAYNNMLENMHLLGTKENYDWLMESKAQLEAGRKQARELL